MLPFFLRKLAVLAILLTVITLAAMVSAQQSSGNLTVRVLAKEGESSSNVTVSLVEETTEAEVSRVRTDKTGVATMHDVPFGTYRVTAIRPDQLQRHKVVTVRSALPLEVVFDTLTEYLGADVTVTSSVSQVLPTQTVRTRIQTVTYPSPTSAQQIETVLLSTPGMVPDEDGRLHLRGQDAHLQYVIDGIPVTANQTRVFSSLFNAKLINVASVIRGGFPAEFGTALAGVVNITTKTALQGNFTAEAAYTLGSDNLSEYGGVAGGKLGKTSGYLIGYQNSETDRYMDPIRSFEPNHTRGSLSSTFAKIDLGLGMNFDLRLLGLFATTRYEVPNMLPASDSAQDQVHDLKEYFGGVRIAYTLAPNALISLTGYGRLAEDLLRSNGKDRIANTADSLEALRRNERFFLGADRQNDNFGGLLEYTTQTHWFDAVNIVKAGASYDVYPTREFFTFAVVDSTMSDSTNGDPRLARYDLTRGGRPFVVDAERTFSKLAGYLQDEVQFADWRIGAGVRVDRFDLFEQELFVSPRLALNYQIDPSIALGLSYNRIVMMPPLEYILTSSSAEGRELAGDAQSGFSNEVKPERSHMVELGADLALGEHFTLGAATYAKLIEDFLVQVELGSSGVIFPVNLKEGMAAGGEVELRLNTWNKFSGYWSVSVGTAVGRRPTDGSSPISAGLIIGEEGHNYAHPFSSEDVFPTEHSQLITSVFGITYDDDTESGLTATIQGRFDSGLPFDLTDANGNGLDPAAARALLRSRGYSDDVIDLLNLGMEEPGSPDKSVAPHAVFDLAVRYDVSRVLPFPVRVTASIANVLDTKYLYRFESTTGGTHFGRPRSFLLEAQLKM